MRAFDAECNSSPFASACTNPHRTLHSESLTAGSNQKRNILSIDGGGVRCVIAMEALCALEKSIQQRHGDNHRVLSDEFDLIAGTSAGGMLASAIALGMPMKEMRLFIESNIKHWFSPMPWYKRHSALYDKQCLAAALREGLGEHTTLGSDSIKTQLMLLTHNWSEDAEWLLTNRAGAAPDGDVHDSHLQLPLWQATLASASAPGYFSPEVIDYGKHTPRKVVLQDGGMTGFLNPAFRAFRYATQDSKGPRWQTGQELLNLVSIGSGDAAYTRHPSASKKRNVLRAMIDVPNALLQCSVREQEALCEQFGAPHTSANNTTCDYGQSVENHEHDKQSSAAALFSYSRINPNLETKSLAKLGCENLTAGKIMALDKPENYEFLSIIGQKTLQSEDIAGIAGMCFKQTCVAAL